MLERTKDLRAGEKLRERLEPRNVPVIYTREAGGVKLNFGAGSWELKTSARQKFSSGTITTNPPALPSQDSKTDTVEDR